MYEKMLAQLKIEKFHKKTLTCKSELESTDWMDDEEEEEEKKPWGNKKAKTHPIEMPTAIATPILEPPRNDEFNPFVLFLINGPSRRPDIIFPSSSSSFPTSNKS